MYIDFFMLILAAILLATLDKKYPFFRMGKLYRDVFWQDAIINFVVLSIIFIGLQVITDLL